MENSETRATMGISHRTKTNKTKNTTQKANKMSNTDPKGKQFLLLTKLPHRGAHRGKCLSVKKTSTLKVKDPLSFEK
jgi:hypothetical protein